MRHSFSRLHQPLRDDHAEKSVFIRRLVVAITFMLLLTGCLFSNLYYLQVIKYDSYLTRSDENRIKITPIPPSRGLILDRNGVVLADNKPLFSLEIIPEQSKNLKEDIKGLRVLLDLDLDDEEIDDLIERARYKRRFLPQAVAYNLTEDQVATFAVNSYRFTAARIEPILKRHYPFRDTLTHALGYVSRINTKDLEKLAEEGKLDNYAATNDIGKQGIEKFYEKILHGINGYKEVEVDSHGRELRTLNEVPPLPGRNLTLSLDIRLQLKAEELLIGKRGAMIMLDPRNGEILAFASAPSYDPNAFVRGIKNAEYKALLNNPNKPLINRVSQGGYAPASTVKPLMLVMGLNEEVVTPSTRFFGGPYFKLPGSEHKFRDWRKWGHGWMDIFRAVEISADTFFYDLAYRTGIDRIHEYMSHFGFGQPSGIDIFEESTGNMPSRSWKKRRHRHDWVPGDTVSVGIGQGYWTTTLIQLARAHAILTQDGRDIKPHLFKSCEVLSKNEQPLTYPVPTQTAIEVKDQRYWSYARDGMCLVINGPEGTGRRAFAGTKYTACGKSGTAQVVSIKQDAKYNAGALKEQHRDNGLFVAFAPKEAPTVLVAAIIENRGGGSSVVAPLVRQLMDAYFKYYDHPIDNQSELLEWSHRNHLPQVEEPVGGKK